MKKLAFVVLVLASQGAMARQGENTLINMEAAKYFPPMYRTDCQIKNKENKPIFVHVEDRAACADIDGTWIPEVNRK